MRPPSLALLTDSFYLRSQFDGGNSAQGTGYAALFPQMIADWRAIWSAVPGTTDPLAPFGFVTLADGTDEAWGLSMAGMRMAQMGSVSPPTRRQRAASSKVAKRAPHL